MTIETESKSKLAAARALREEVSTHREAIEQDCRLPDPLVGSLAATGVFRALLPRSGDGEEWDHPTWCRFIEEVSQFDGAVGWSAGPGPGSGGIVGGWLSDDAVRKICSSPGGGVVAGVGAPLGTATKEDGGVRLSGRWPFGSGVWHADWVLCGFHYEKEQPEIGKMLLVPRNEVQIVDTWSVGGMRGTASDDYAVNDSFAPAEFMFDVTEEPRQHGPLYRFPIAHVFGSCLGALALGIARGSIDVFTNLIREKIDNFTGTPMSHRPTLRERIARSEAQVRSAKAFYYETMERCWEIVCSGRPMNPKEEALGQLAFRHAVDASVQAVDIVYHAAGTSAIFTKNPLERFFRDIHVARQHRFASPEELHAVGGVMLDTD